MAIDKRIPYLDTERLAEIFKNKIKNPKCPFCDSEEWALPLPPGMTGVGIPWSVGPHYVHSGFPAVMLHCKNCGFMRMHYTSSLNGVLVVPDTGTDCGTDNGGVHE